MTRYLLSQRPTARIPSSFISCILKLRYENTVPLSFISFTVSVNSFLKSCRSLRSRFRQINPSFSSKATPLPSSIFGSVRIKSGSNPLDDDELNSYCSIFLYAFFAAPLHQKSEIVLKLICRYNIISLTLKSCSKSVRSSLIPDQNHSFCLLVVAVYYIHCPRTW